MANWYCGSTKWTAVTAWAASTAYSIGDIRRQNAAPTAGNERVFRCTTAGTSGGTEPTWTITAGGTTNDNTAVWTEITGQAAYNGDGGGTAWAAPHARLSTALSFAAAGDTVFVSNNHAASIAASTTLSLSGTLASPQRIICVDDAQVPATNFTAWATTATETATGTWTVQGTGTSTGTAYWYGVSLVSGSTSVGGGIVLGGNKTELTFDAVKLTLTANSANPRIHLGISPLSTAVGNKIRLKNCTCKFANSAQAIAVRGGKIEIESLTVDPTGTAPAALVQTSAATAATCILDACDLSAVTNTLADVSGSGMLQDILIVDSKIAASVAMTTGTIVSRATRFRMHNSDSGSTNYRYYYADYNGTIQQETTTVRTGGASNGTTPISWAMATTANSKMEFPLNSEEIAIWNDTTGSSRTARVEIAGASSLTNADIWMEVEYLGNASFPISSIATSAPTNLLTAGSTLSTSSEAWGGSPANTQYITVSFTPQMKGVVKVRLFLAKASYTAYVDPKVTIS